MAQSRADNFFELQQNRKKPSNGFFQKYWKSIFYTCDSSDSMVSSEKNHTTSKKNQKFPLIDDFYNKKIVTVQPRYHGFCNSGYNTAMSCYSAVQW